MQQVPTVVKYDGKPVQHGIVERHFDSLRAIIQMYVTDVQEARISPSLPIQFLHATNIDDVCHSHSYSRGA